MITLQQSDGFGFRIIESCKSFGMHDDGTLFFEKPVLKVAFPGINTAVVRITVDFNSPRPGINIYTAPFVSHFFPLFIEWP